MWCVHIGCETPVGTTSEESSTDSSGKVRKMNVPYKCVCVYVQLNFIIKILITQNLILRITIRASGPTKVFINCVGVKVIWILELNQSALH